MRKRKVKICEHRRPTTLLPHYTDKYETFPSLTRLSDGTYLCCFLSSDDKIGNNGMIRMLRSADGCKTWTEGQAPPAVEEKSGYGYMMCHITELGDRSLLACYLRILLQDGVSTFFHPATNGIMYGVVRIAKSYDGGRSWGDARTIDYHLPDIIVPGKCEVLPDGVIGLPCEVWHEWDRGFRQGPSSRFILSYDNGRTWPEAAILARDEAGHSIYGDPRLSTGEDGVMKAYFWRYSLKEGSDLPIHSAVSRDQGRSWSRADSIGLNGQVASPIDWGGGHITCIYQRRFGRPGLCAISSYDGGRSWDDESEVVIYESAEDTADHNPFTGYKEYTFGYSSVIKISDSEALVIYWHNNSKSDGRTAIRISKLLLE